MECVNMIDSIGVLGLRAPVSEDKLRALSKEISSLFKSHESDPDTEWVQYLIDILLNTAYDATLSSSHCTAASNALCASISLCLATPHGPLASIVRQQTTCQRLFLICIDRYNGGKAKSMEQVLSTTLALVSSCALHDANRLPTEECIRRILNVLFHDHDKVKAKSSLHALTLFLSRDLVSLHGLLEIYCRNGSNTSAEVMLVESSKKVVLFQQFLFSIFEWVTFADAASGAGQLCAAIIKKQSLEPIKVLKEGQVRQSVLLWAEPLLNSICSHPESLRDFKHSVFPGLFKNRIHDYWNFLHYLGIESHLPGSQQVVDEDHLVQYDSNIIRDIFFSALEVGKEVGLLQESDDEQQSVLVLQNSIIYAKTSCLGHLLNSATPSTRLAALTLLIRSQLSTRPYSKRALKALRENIPHLHGDTDANFRGEVLGLVKTLIYRLRSILASLFREMLNHNKAQPVSNSRIVSTKTIDAHVNFLKWYIGFLLSELRPSAAYQRHISALKSLNVLIQSGLDPSIEHKHLARQAKQPPIWSVHLKIVNDSTIRGVADLLLNAFDDIRQEAADILKRFWIHPVRSGKGCDESDTTWARTLARGSEAVLQSGRVDFADGVAHIHDLLSYRRLARVDGDSSDSKSAHSAAVAQMEILVIGVEAALQVAQADLVKAVERHPVHGIFTALRYVFEGIRPRLQSVEKSSELSFLLERIYNCIVGFWDRVKPLVCNDAPEGFLPGEVEDSSDLTSKDVSSYAWRTIKESSLLLRTLVSKETLTACYSKPSVIRHHLNTIGPFCFLQLSELRHRGASATVAQTFGAVCTQCGSSADDETKALLSEWYNECLALIDQKGSATTRRSAGLPALVTSIISADETGILFEKASHALTSIANQPPHSTPGMPAQVLPQVHALNCLKALFTSAKLAERSERHVVDAMHVSARCLTSDIWAIRNCGLMLFRGLIDRLLGSNEKLEGSRSNAFGVVSRLSYDAYPGLLDLVMMLLDNAQAAISDAITMTHGPATQPGLIAEAIFPILDLLRRAPPPEEHRPTMQQLILHAASNPHWHIRELAAKTLAASIKEQEVLDTAEVLLEGVSQTSNELHGRLLCLRSLILMLANSESSTARRQIPQFFKMITSRSTQLSAMSSNRHVVATYVQILNVFGQYLCQFGADQVESSSSLQLLCLDFIRISRTIQGMLTGESLLQQAMEINAWLAHLTSALLRQALPAEWSPTIDRLYATIFASSTDADISASVLERLDVMLENASRAVNLMLVEALAGLLTSGQGESIQHVCEALLAKRIITCEPAKGVDWMSIRPLMDHLYNIDVPRRFQSPKLPTSEETAIRIWGLSMSSQWETTEPEDHDLENETKAWLLVLSVALGDSNYFELRHAAVQSMLAFVTPYKSHQILPEDLQVLLLLTLYEALNDDDVEIRELAANTAALVVGVDTSKPMLAGTRVPTVAAQMLCSHLLTSHAQSSTLLRAGIWRLIGQTSSDIECKPAGSTLGELLAQRTSLFEEEKQNLYRDEVRDCKIWAEMLLRLPINPTDMSAVLKFADWVLQGLKSLKEEASKGPDGPLGWTSKADIFVLGMRVIFGARVVLRWRSTSRFAQIPAAAVRQEMMQLLSAGLHRSLHDIWMQEMAHILENSMLSGVKKVANVLNGILIS